MEARVTPLSFAQNPMSSFSSVGMRAISMSSALRFKTYPMMTMHGITESISQNRFHGILGLPRSFIRRRAVTPKARGGPYRSMETLWKFTHVNFGAPSAKMRRSESSTSSCWPGFVFPMTISSRRGTDMLWRCRSIWKVA